jgi:hypothetical protein
MKKLLFSSILLLFLSSCNSFKLIKLLKEGSVEQASFKTEIPFEMRLGLIIVPVTINGKTYDFLVDTGAPNLCTEELAAELNLETVVSQKAGDSQGVKEELDFVVMPDMYLNGICFKQTGAAVADLNKSEVLACLNADGIIGANLMKEAVWEIDYERKVITISEKRASFEIPDSVIHVPFSPALSFTPRVNITYNGVEDKNVTFDTGSNGYFASSKTVYKSIKDKTPTIKEARSFGSSGSGLYGAAVSDTNITARIDSTRLGDLTIQSNVVTFEKGSRTLGTKFLQNYRVIIDWSVNEILLIPVKPFKHSTYESFGFSPFISENKLIVSDLFINSQASKKGIQLGTQILEANGVDYRTLSTDQWCSIIQNGLVPEEQKTLKMLVLIDNQEVEIELTKVDLVNW